MEGAMLEEMLAGDEGKYANLIKAPVLRKFVEMSLKKYGTSNKLIEANRVAEYVIARIEKNGIEIQDSAQVQWIDMLLTATMVHNLFYDGTLGSIFRARENLTSIGLECGIPAEAQEPIWQAVEAQLGDDMPVAALRPNHHSPTGILAEACWNIEERLGGKKMPDLSSPIN